MAGGWITLFAVVVIGVFTYFWWSTPKQDNGGKSENEESHTPKGDEKEKEKEKEKDRDKVLSVATQKAEGGLPSASRKVDSVGPAKTSTVEESVSEIVCTSTGRSVSFSLASASDEELDDRINILLRQLKEKTDKGEIEEEIAPLIRELLDETDPTISRRSHSRNAGDDASPKQQPAESAAATAVSLTFAGSALVDSAFGVHSIPFIPVRSAAVKARICDYLLCYLTAANSHAVSAASNSSLSSVSRFPFPFPFISNSDPRKRSIERCARLFSESEVNAFYDHFTSATETLLSLIRSPATQTQIQPPNTVAIAATGSEAMPKTSSPKLGSLSSSALLPSLQTSFLSSASASSSGSNGHDLIVDRWLESFETLRSLECYRLSLSLLSRDICTVYQVYHRFQSAIEPIYHSDLLPQYPLILNHLTGALHLFYPFLAFIGNWFDLIACHGVKPANNTGKWQWEDGAAALPLLPALNSLIPFVDSLALPPPAKSGSEWYAAIKQIEQSCAAQASGAHNNGLCEKFRVLSIRLSQHQLQTFASCSESTVSNLRNAVAKYLAAPVQLYQFADSIAADDSKIRQDDESEVDEQHRKRPESRSPEENVYLKRVGAVVYLPSLTKALHACNLPITPLQQPLLSGIYSPNEYHLFASQADVQEELNIRLSSQQHNSEAPAAIDVEHWSGEYVYRAMAPDKPAATPALASAGANAAAVSWQLRLNIALELRHHLSPISSPQLSPISSPEHSPRSAPLRSQDLSHSQHSESFMLPPPELQQNPLSAALTPLSASIVGENPQTTAGAGHSTTAPAGLSASAVSVAGLSASSGSFVLLSASEYVQPDLDKTGVGATEKK